MSFLRTESLRSSFQTGGGPCLSGGDVAGVRVHPSQHGLQARVRSVYGVVRGTHWRWLVVVGYLYIFVHSRIAEWR